MTEKSWIEIRIPVAQKSCAAMTNYLFELGCVGLQESSDEIIAYFPTEEQPKALISRISEYQSGLKSLGFIVAGKNPSITQLENRDWNAEWKKQLKPLSVSRRFMVKPTWAELSGSASEFVIEIDPKQAFGTGSHATTQLILQLLENIDIAGKQVLDVGTGTSILAIAAAMMGANRITAFDIDPVAVEAACENVAINGVSEQITLFVGGPRALLPIGGFEIILANITKNVIIAALPDLDSALARGGHLILSGILVTEMSELKERLADFAFQVSEEKMIGEWAALQLHKDL